MRVIAGLAKGRKLLGPADNLTRPTPDRVREALFSILAAHVDGATVLDLYAGSGALGIEALSRGASHCIFVERHRPALARLKKNLAALGPEFTQRAEILPIEVEKATRLLLGQSFGLIFADPPYAQHALQKTLAALDTHNMLAVDGRVIVEHASKQQVPGTPGGMIFIQTRKFGDVSLSFFRHK